MSIAMTCDEDKEILSVNEQAMVDKLGAENLYNRQLKCVTSPLGLRWSDEAKTRVGLQRRGRKSKPETRAKIAESLVGNTRCKGRSLSDEHKEAVGAALRGKKRPPEVFERVVATRRKNGWFTPEGLENVHAANKRRRGRSHTPEHRAKIGASGTGRKASPETLAKMSASQKGRPKTEEHCAKIAASLTGKKQSEATIAKKSAARRGVPLKETTKAKIGASNKGKRRTPEQKANISAGIANSKRLKNACG